MSFYCRHQFVAEALESRRLLTGGGPDAFGHLAESTTHESIDLAPGAAGVVTLIDNNTGGGPALLSLGANEFRFYGTTYTSMYVSPTGLITFTSADGSGANTDLSNSPSGPAIAVLWDAWSVTQKSSAAGASNDCVLYRYDPAHQRIIIEWNAVNIGGSGDDTFAVMLQLNTSNQDGLITFNYRDLTAADAAHDAGVSATAGIRSGTGDSILTHFNAVEPLVASGKSIRIRAGNPYLGGSLRGVAFVESNLNGVRDAGEALLPGATVFLDANGNLQLDEAEARQVTDYDGSYWFRGILGGVYMLTTQATPTSVPVTCRPVTIAPPTAPNTPGDTITQYDAANIAANNGDAVAAWPDSSGNGRDATQPTPAARATYQNDVLNLNHEPALLFGGNQSYTSLFNNVDLSNGVTVMAVVTPGVDGPNNTYTFIGDIGAALGVGVTTQSARYNGNYRAVATPDFGRNYEWPSFADFFAKPKSAIVMASFGGGQPSTISINGFVAWSSSTTPVDMTNTAVAKAVLGQFSGTFFNGNIAFMQAMAHAADMNERLQWETYLTQRYGVEYASLLVFPGESITQGISTSGPDGGVTGMTYPGQTVGLLGSKVSNNWALMNQGVASTNFTDGGGSINAYLQRRVLNYINPLRPHNVVVLLAPFRNQYYGVNGPYTAQQLYDFAATYATQVTNAGGSMVLLTHPRWGNDTVANAQIVAADHMLVSNPPAGSLVANAIDDPRWANSLNPTYFYQLHPNNAGARVAAEYVAAQINAILAQPPMPAGSIAVGAAPLQFIGTSGADNFTVRLDPSEPSVVQVLGNGDVVVGQLPLDILAASGMSLVFNTDGGDDSLTIDPNVGDALANCGIVFIGGGDSAGDSLTIGGVSGSSLKSINLNGVEQLHIDQPMTFKLGADTAIKTLTINPSARLDIADHHLTIDYTGTTSIGSWNGTGYSGVTGMIVSGRNGGSWNGAGIVTSQPSAQNPSGLMTIGITEASQVVMFNGAQTAAWAGETVDSTTLLMRYTFAGDADLNGRIDADDYFWIDRGSNRGWTGYGNGDFNYDGKVNGDDYFLIDSNFAASQSGAPAASAGLAAESPDSEIASGNVFSTAKIASAYYSLIEEAADSLI